MTTYGLDVLGAVIILVIGVWFAGRAAAFTQRTLAKNPRVDDTLVHFFASCVRYATLAVVVVAVLNQFGVQTTT